MSQAGELPKSWQQVYSTVEPTVPAWLSDLARRVEQLRTIRATPLDRLGETDLWLGGLSAPEAFITAARQEIARVSASRCAPPPGRSAPLQTTRPSWCCCMHG